MTKTFAIASSLIIAAGCASHEEQQQARYNGSYSENNYSSPNYQTPAPSTSIENNNNNLSSSSSSSQSGSMANGGAEVNVNLESQIRQSLQNNSDIAVIAPNILISANNGAVTLSGTCNSEEQKRQIESLVQQTTGVVTVNNQLQVSQSSQSSVSGKENQNLSSTGSSSGNQMQTSAQGSEAQGGASGVSATENEKLASSGEKQSSDIFGASNASSNNLSGASSTETMTPTSSSESSRIYSESSSNQLENSASDQKLSPTSDRSSESSQSSQSGSISGSTPAGASGGAGSETTANANSTSGTASPSGQSSASEQGGLNLNIQATSESDRTLSQQISQQLRADTSLMSVIPQVRISIDNGQVTLRGTVQTEEQKHSIESTIQRVTGVTGVNNEIRVSASQSNQAR